MDIIDIKFENVKKVINAIRFRNGMTKREITDETGLSFSTVSNICNVLKEKQVLCDQKSEAYGVGRTPSKLIFKYEKYCCACINLQRKGIMGISILDFSQYAYFNQFYDISTYRSVECLADYAAGLIARVTDDLRERDIRMIGAGIAISGIFDRRTGIVKRCAVPLYQDTPLSEIFQQKIHLPCYVDNEANLCVLSMQQQGPGSESDLVYIHSDQGLGVGVVSNGGLIRGKNGYAAEIAHIALGNDDEVCPYCHRKGCAEHALSFEGMNVPGNNGEAFYQQRGNMLGELVVLLANLFDPRTIYIGGAAFLQYDKLQPYIEKKLRDYCPELVERGLKPIYDPESSETICRGINEAVYDSWNPLA